MNHHAGVELANPGYEKLTAPQLSYAAYIEWSKSLAFTRRFVESLADKQSLPAKYSHYLESYRHRGGNEALAQPLNQHSLRVSLAAGEIVQHTTRNQDLTAEAVLAGLLHDAGKTALLDSHPDLFDEHRRYNRHDRQLMSSHTRLGFQMLARDNDENGLPPYGIAAYVAAMHHAYKPVVEESSNNSGASWSDVSKLKDALVERHPALQRSPRALDRLTLAVMMADVADAILHRQYPPRELRQDFHRAKIDTTEIKNWFSRFMNLPDIALAESDTDTVIGVFKDLVDSPGSITHALYSRTED